MSVVRRLCEGSVKILEKKAKSAILISAGIMPAVKCHQTGSLLWYEGGRHMNIQRVTTIRSIMLLAIILITAIGLSACGDNSSQNSSQNAQANSDAVGEAYLDHFAKVNETGKSFGELNEKYGLNLDGETDEFHLYTSDDGSLSFGFLSTNRITVDNGVGETEEVPGPPLDTDPCRCMAGSAEYMLGITEAVRAQDFAVSCESQLQQGLESGHGTDIETYGSTGLIGVFTLESGDTYQIFLQDVTEDGKISPYTKVHVLYEPEE